MQIVLATANPDKAAEIRNMLPDFVQLLERPREVGEVVEDGETLEANARLKAVAICAASGLPAVADDTGLEVDALGGAPGIHAARFAGENATYADNVNKLLADLHGVAAPQRTARFRTVALLRNPDGSELVAHGVVEGTITETPRGESGFGYDPVFAPTEVGGATFAEMTDDAKNAISHRARAFANLSDLLTSRPNGEL